MKTKNTPVPNNYSLFRVNYSDNRRTTRQLLAFCMYYSNICGTTRQLHVFSGKLLVFTFNYSFFPTTPDSHKLSENYPFLSAIR